jgi:tetratricopeptide (TPR) repeat protein
MKISKLWRLFVYQFVISMAVLFSAAVTANQSLSPKTYQALNDIQTLLTEEKYSEVEEGLLDLEENLTPGFGLALTYQIHAQLYLAKENSEKALVYFNKALALEAMKAIQAVSLATNVAQLYLADNQVDQAILTLKPRIKAAEKEKTNGTNAMAFITLGSAYQIKQDYAKAVLWLRQGLDRAKKPRENWLQMLMAAHYQLKQYAEAISVIDQLIVLNETKEEYWLQQASLNQMMNKPKAALKVLQLAYVRDLLVKEDGLILLVQLLIGQGVPERGGRILLDLLEQEKIELNDDNWKLLASAWLQSRDRKKAIQAFIQAAELSANNKEKKAGAKLYYRAAQLQFDESDFKGAVSSFSKAREFGISGKKLGLSLLMQGNSYFELEDYNNAKLYFSKALNEASSTNSARAWLDYMEQLELF